MPTTSAPPTATNGQLVRWAFKMLNHHDVSPLRPFWTAETVERFPDRTCRGPDEITAYFEDVFAAIPDFQMEIMALAEQGDDVFVHWQLSGTHLGVVQGIAPTGKGLRIDGMDHFVIRDRKVISNFVVFDQMQLARQMGVMPGDGSRTDKALKAAFNARMKLATRTRR